MPKANPEYFHLFDFAFLTGNSLTYIGGGSREYTKKAQQIVVNRFAKLIKKGGYLLIDHRNYDYIRSLMNLPRKEIFKNFSFDYSIYYHGSKDRIVVFPAYISDTVVIIHYYDMKRKIWSKLNLYPIYHKDMMEILGEEFVVEKVWHDFGKVKEGKSLFVQYLCRKK